MKERVSIHFLPSPEREKEKEKIILYVPVQRRGTSYARRGVLCQRNPFLRITPGVVKKIKAERRSPKKEGSDREGGWRGGAQERLLRERGERGFNRPKERRSPVTG